MAKKENTTSIGFEEIIWRAADKLRGNLNASEYEGVVLGLIFLKYISDKFEAKFKELQEYEYADKPCSYLDWMSRDYFKYLLDHAEQVYWDKPGGTGSTKREYSIKYDAENAYNKALEAIEDYSKGLFYCWHEDWREIYGSKFPES